MRSLGTVHLLDEDPTLLELLTERERPAAHRALTAECRLLERGEWHPRSLGDGERTPFGLLVLDGLVLRDVAVAQTICGELVGSRELLRPWDASGDRTPMPFEIGWKVIQPVRIAELDADFPNVLAMWPRLVNAFVDRAVERSHSLALHVAIHCIRRVDVSLMVLFSHLADRFGKVTVSGVRIPVPLSQTDLGRLVGATRQSVSTALKDLARSRSLIREDRGTWLMQHDATEEIQEMLSRRQRAHILPTERTSPRQADHLE